MLIGNDRTGRCCCCRQALFHSNLGPGGHELKMYASSRDVELYPLLSVTVSGTCNYFTASAFEVCFCSSCERSKTTWVIVFCCSVCFYEHLIT